MTEYLKINKINTIETDLHCHELQNNIYCVQKQRKVRQFSDPCDVIIGPTCGQVISTLQLEITICRCINNDSDHSR